MATSNPYRAAIASILGVPQKEIPNISLSSPKWFSRTREFCKSRGLDCIGFSADNTPEIERVLAMSNTSYIALGPEGECKALSGVVTGFQPSDYIFVADATCFKYDERGNVVSLTI